MDFQLKARELLRDEMKRQNITVAQLAERLSEIGAPEAIQSLGVKISRGTFQLSFFLRCLAAMGVQKFEFEVPSRIEAKDDPSKVLRVRPAAAREEAERARFLRNAKAPRRKNRENLAFGQSAETEPDDSGLQVESSDESTI